MAHININNKRVAEKWLIHLQYEPIVEKLLGFNFKEAGIKQSSNETDLSYIKEFGNKSILIILFEWHTGYSAIMTTTNIITNEVTEIKFKFYFQLLEHMVFILRKEKIFKILNT